MRATPAALDAPTTAPLENSAEVAYRAKLRRRMRQHNEPCLLPDRAEASSTIACGAVTRQQSPRHAP